ncbi:MAG: alpha/beta hydrolase [Actinomycetes bacterium]
MRGKLIILAAISLALVGAGCSQSANGGSVGQTPSPGLVNIGGGRAIYVQCTGSGSPTVIMVPGSRSSHQVWDSLRTGPNSDLTRSEGSVYARVGQITRVCTYDRPGTTPADGSTPASTLVTQPTTAQAGVADLQAWLKAAGVSGPYIVVSHSWGGMIASLFASTHSTQIAGLVFVDPATPYLQTALTPAQWNTLLGLETSLIDGSGLEVPNYEDSMDVVRKARLPTVPTVVITSDQAFDFGAGGPATWPAWGKAQAEFAASLHADHITSTNSDHLIPINQPKLVTDAIVGVVEKARNQSAGPTPS